MRSSTLCEVGRIEAARPAVPLLRTSHNTSLPILRIWEPTKEEADAMHDLDDLIRKGKEYLLELDYSAPRGF